MVDFASWFPRELTVCAFTDFQPDDMNGLAVSGPETSFPGVQTGFLAIKTCLYRLCGKTIKRTLYSLRLLRSLPVSDSEASGCSGISIS